MTLLDTLLRRKSFTPTTVPHDTSAPLTYALTLPEDNDYKRTVGQGGNTSIVGVFLNWLIRQYPEAVLQVTRQNRDGTVEPVVPHDLTDLVERPNDYYDSSALWTGKIISETLDGNAYWLKVRNASTRVVGLWYIPHFMIEPKGGERDFIEFYDWRVGGQRYKVPPSEIIHFRFGLDPENPRKGLGPLKAQLRELYSDEEAARFTAAMLHNFGVPGMVVTPAEGAPSMDQPAVDKVKAKFDQEFGGSNRGRTIVLSNGAHVVPLSFSPDQMNLGDLRDIPEERISAALGIPAAVVGLGAGLAQTKVGATMHELRELATEQALVPQWKNDAKQLKRSLLYEFTGDDPSYSLRFDTSDVRVLQEDRDKLHARTMAAFTGGAITRATVQTVLGYPVDPNGEIYLESIAVQEVPLGTTPAAPAAPKSLGMKAVPSALGFLRLIDRARPGLERAFARALAPAFAELGHMAEEAFSSSVVKALAIAGKGNGRDRKVALPEDEQIADTIVQALGFEDYRTGTLRPVYAAHYSQAAQAAIGAYADAFGATLAVGVRDVAAETLIREGGRRLGLIDLREETRTALLSALADAREAGLGIPQTARLIREYVPAGRFTSAGAQYRANMIARTETRWATNVSVAEVGQLAGFEEYQAYDSRTGSFDEECDARDGQIYTYDEMLAEMDNTHPNDTLSFSPVPRT